MLKTIALSIGLSALVATATVANAQYTGPTNAAPITVKQLLETGKDEQFVTLRGHLVKRIGDDEYLFADSTGEIEVDIDDEAFPAQQPIDPNTEVELTGEFDKELIGKPEIDVAQVKLLR